MLIATFYKHRPRPPIVALITQQTLLKVTRYLTPIAKKEKLGMPLVFFLEISTSTSTSDVNMCVIQRTHTRLGDRSFAVAGTRLWNSLGDAL